MPTLSETEVQDEYILLYLISNCWSTLRLSALLSVLCSHFSAALSWKLSERSIREYSAAPCAVCVCCVCVRALVVQPIRFSTHQWIKGSIRLHLFWHTHKHTQRSSRGICEQQSMLKATLSEPLEMNAALSVCLSLRIQPCVHTLSTVGKRMNGSSRNLIHRHWLKVVFAFFG